MESKMYTTEEAAKALNLKVNTVRVFIRQGKIHAIKYTETEKGSWYISEEEIKRLKREK